MKVFTYPLLISISIFISDVESLRFPGFFVPEEVQTILSIFWSNLPPIKLGSDQRFGVGFRLGRNADAQILVELGPQSETQPLGDSSAGFNKRENNQEKIDNVRTKRRKNIASEHKNVNRRKPAKKLDETNIFSQENSTIGTNNQESISKELTTKPNNKARKQTRRQKKVKSPDETVPITTTDLPINSHNNDIGSDNIQKRSEHFLNNFMSWLNQHNTRPIKSNQNQLN